MALNPQYEAIGKGFVQQYYALFDDPTQRPNLVNMYNVSRQTFKLLTINNFLYVFPGRIILHDFRRGSTTRIC